MKKIVPFVSEERQFESRDESLRTADFGVMDNRSSEQKFIKHDICFQLSSSAVKHTIDILRIGIKTKIIQKIEFLMELNQFSVLVFKILDQWEIDARIKPNGYPNRLSSGNVKVSIETLIEKTKPVLAQFGYLQFYQNF